jgi:hypothetical protein
MKRTLVVALSVLAFSGALALDWPSSDQELDRLLRRESPAYKLMATTVEKRQGYQIESIEDLELGMVVPGSNSLVIQLGSELTAERRATVLIWEMANAFFQPRFDEIHKRALEGTIGSATEYGLRMEIVEYDSFRHHRAVLEQLVEGNDVDEGELLFLVTSTATKVADYRLPYAHDYIEEQAKNGHTSYFESYFPRQARKEGPP